MIDENQTNIFDFLYKPFKIDKKIRIIEFFGYDEYIFVEGYHCSCYDFDDTEWEAIKYTKDELIELAKVKIDDKYCDNQIFYTMILNYFGR